MRTLALWLVAISIGLVTQANEPLWTDKERATKRDLVVDGRIISAKSIGVLKNYKWSELWSAEVKVLAMQKGDPKLVGQTHTVYFERGAPRKGGGRWVRCPGYADLRPGDRVKVFLRRCTESHLKRLGLPKDSKGALFLEMGSDCKALGGDPAGGTAPVRAGPQR